jgi:hypothetical protein
MDGSISCIAGITAISNYFTSVHSSSEGFYGVQMPVTDNDLFAIDIGADVNEIAE